MDQLRSELCQCGKVTKSRSAHTTATPSSTRLSLPPPAPAHTEVLQQTGAATFLEPRWWNVGYAKLTTDEELAYLGIPGLRIAGGQGVAIIAFCQVRHCLRLLHCLGCIVQK